MMKIVGVEAFRLHPKIMKEAWVEDEYGLAQQDAELSHQSDGR